MCFIFSFCFNWIQLRKIIWRKIILAAAHFSHCRSSSVSHTHHCHNTTYKLWIHFVMNKSVCNNNEHAWSKWHPFVTSKSYSFYMTLIVVSLNHIIIFHSLWFWCNLPFSTISFFLLLHIFFLFFMWFFLISNSIRPRTGFYCGDLRQTHTHTHTRQTIHYHH